MFYRIFNCFQSALNENNEHRVMAELRHGAMPPWVKSARWAPTHLKDKGVDIVVETDVRLVYLQLKSGYSMAHFFKHFTEVPLAIIVVTDDTPTELLRMRLMEGLEYGYNRSSLI